MSQENSTGAERLLSPELHPGWAWVRVAWALSMLATWLPRGQHVPETYSTDGILVVTGYTYLTQKILFSPSTAWGLFIALVVGTTAVGLGWRPWFTRLGIGVALTCACLLCFHEGLNTKAYDRLLFWEGLALMLAPGAASGRHLGSPVARYMMILTFMGLYGSTGWIKITQEPRWWQGLPLAYDMIHRSFGMKPLGIWLSDKFYLLKPMSWMTMLFEASFPMLIWIRQVRPWLLLVGIGFHLSIWASMNVNTFSAVALAAYPVLLSPDEFNRIQQALFRRSPPAKAAL